MSALNHASCVPCWNELHPGRAVDGGRYRRGSLEVCCWCGKDTISGIYVKGDPREVPCHGNHREDL